MYAPNQTLSYSLDGGSFLAIDAPNTEFFSHTLPDHLRRYYFLNFLYVLGQRLILMQISEAIAFRWVGKRPMVRGTHSKDLSQLTEEQLQSYEQDLSDRVNIFEDIWDELLEFSARIYFIQFMHTQNHHRDYKRWQDVFEVKDLYGAVTNGLQQIRKVLWP